MNPTPQEKADTTSAWGEFWIGLTRPSTGSIGIALAVTALIFAALMTWVDDSFFRSGLAPYLATRNLDNDAYATIEAMRMSQRAAAAPPLVVVLGASATLDSVDAALLEESLDRGAGSEHQVYKLATGGQDLWDSMMLAGAIPADSRGVVAIGTPPSRLIQDRETLETLATSPRIGITSPWFDEELRLENIDVPYRTGIYLIDQNKFLFARVPAMLRNFVKGPIPQRDMPTLGSQPMSAEMWARRTPPLIERLSAWDENVENNLRVLERLIGHLRESTGVRVILVEPPVNPRFLREPGVEEFFLRHKQRMQEFASTQNCPYVDISTEIAVVEDDFRDWFHLRIEETAQRYTTRLAEHISDLEADGDPAAGVPTGSAPSGGTP